MVEKNNAGAGQEGRVKLWLLLAPGVPVLLAVLGYVKLVMVHVALGAPALAPTVEESVRAGASMVGTTASALPSMLMDVLTQPWRWLSFGLPSLALYTLLLAWIAHQIPFQRWIGIPQDGKHAAVIDLLVGLTLVLLAAWLLDAAHAAVLVQGLLTDSSTTRMGTTGELEATIRAGDLAGLTRRYTAFLVAWLGVGHLVAVFVWPRKSHRPAAGIGARVLGWTAAVLVVLALSGLPAYHALIRVTSDFPQVSVFREDRQSGDAVVEGLLIDQNDDWLVVYTPKKDELRILASSTVEEVRPGPSARLFERGRRGSE